MSSPFGGGSPFSGGGGGGGGGGAPSGPAGGDLGGTYPNPTVTDLTITSEAQGDVLYFDGTNWVRLGAGTAGQVLQTQGAGANPQWVDAATGDLGQHIIRSTIEPRLDNTNMSSSGVPIFATDATAEIAVVAGQGICFEQRVTSAAKCDIETRAIWYSPQNLPGIGWRMSDSQVPTTYQISIGWQESTDTQLAGALDPGTNHVGIQFSSATDTNWMFVHRGSGAQVRDDSGYAYTQGEVLIFEVYATSATTWALKIKDKTGATTHASTTLSSDVPGADTNMEVSAGGQWISGSGTLEFRHWGGHITDRLGGG